MRRKTLAGLATATVAASTAIALIAPTSHAASGTYSLIVQPDQGIQPIYDLINSAHKSIDLTMYELVDTTAQKDLVAKEKAGVKVRVILDQRRKSTNSSTYTYLKNNGVSVVWSSSTYYFTHEKTMVVDGSQAVIMSGNMTSQYYAADRNYSVTDTDSADVSAIEKVFNADYATKSVTPGDGDHLVWSPTDSQSQLLALIDGAKSNLYVENQEMGDSQVVSALTAAAKRGVQVEVVMSNTGNTYASEFNTLTSGGVKVSTYAATAPLYIHAKAIVADQKVFVGSENFSSTSLNKNRELGLILDDAKIAGGVQKVITNDFKGATPWS
ncbi:phosphatidylserine/phosphatidylglycerophosphate/cardiolipin synthase family protein [Streptantibioticus rubrisoli]|uniref:phospholipase D n=1 Tax=Streptantibioticus rubrisoli TaxID=1387313 RepID=A0ABT1PGG0_9ACTN|nr:phospholipase D-like domain-containing protein [Streptantibioticus rubrisoli]MCQ4044439.1 phospholipase D-like domain-containing protein [Streptantibioticus rubrisoli]